MGREGKSDPPFARNGSAKGRPRELQKRVYPPGVLSKEESITKLAEHLKGLIPVGAAAVSPTNGKLTFL